MQTCFSGHRLESLVVFIFLSVGIRTIVLVNFPAIIGSRFYLRPVFPCMATFSYFMALFATPFGQHLGWFWCLPSQNKHCWHPEPLVTLQILIWCLGLAEKHGSKWWCGFRVDQLQFWGQFCCNALQPKVTKSCVLAANWEELTPQNRCFFFQKKTPLWFFWQTMIVHGVRHIAPIGLCSGFRFCVWHCSDKQHDVLMRISDRSDGYYANHVCSEDLRLFWSARDPNVSCSRAAGNDRSNHMHTS